MLKMPETPQMPEMADNSALNRRTLLRGVGLVGVAGAAGVPMFNPSAGKPEGLKPDGKALGPTSDVPVGGGKLYEDAGVIVTQPKAGKFNGFSAFCTHQGCPISEFKNNQMICNCHNAIFSAEDGHVIQGPSKPPKNIKPAPKQKIVVQKGQIFKAK
jgi:nitrite reductase/ring-hydroxylating ferredoxin subunit